MIDITDAEDMVENLRSLGHRRFCHTCDGQGVVPYGFIMLLGQRTRPFLITCPCCGGSSRPGWHDFFMYN